MSKKFNHGTSQDTTYMYTLIFIYSNCLLSSFCSGPRAEEIYSMEIKVLEHLNSMKQVFDNVKDLSAENLYLYLSQMEKDYAVQVPQLSPQFRVKEILRRAEGGAGRRPAPAATAGSLVARNFFSLINK